MDYLYSTTCDECKDEIEVNLGLKDDVFKPLLIAIEKAFKKLHKKGTYKPGDIKNTKVYKDVVLETNKILSSSINGNTLSPEMLDSLENDIFIFSGLKTHAQLFEASRQLLTEDKKIKSFSQFSKDVKDIPENHKKYLKAEYNFAVGSVLMAESWENYSDDEETYMIQYRTDGGPNVRPSHAALNGITLPKSDPFWKYYRPKNGWECHCKDVEVLAFSYPKSNSADATKKGEVATTQINKSGKNALAIFRFNSGIQKVVFPPEHPYSKVEGANKVKKDLKR